jgi:hypothetical protein
MLSTSLRGIGTGYLLQEREIHPVLSGSRNHAVKKGLYGLLLFLLAWTYEHRQRCDESALSPADLSVACFYRSMKKWEHQQQVSPARLQMLLVSDMQT